MNRTILPVSFFFGANNRDGYCSLYADTYNSFEGGCHLILKGGPGTGKSTIMKKVAEKLEKRGYYVERGYCSADPNSLDIVVAPEIGFSILDGTAPHIIDPVLPGVSDHIIDLSVAWDRDYLKSHGEEIKELTAENKRLHKKTADFLGVASQIDAQGVILGSDYIDKEKLQRYITRLCNRLIPDRADKKRGKEHKRFLSAITPDGIAVQHDSVVALAENVVTVEDEYGLVSPYIAESIGEYALSRGYDIYKSYCPLFPRLKAEHIIIPKLKVAFFTENSYHPSIDDCGKKVHASRFLDTDGIDSVREKLLFGKKAKRELIDEAVRKLSLALDVHNRLEEYYIKATDFEKIDIITKSILSKI